jgi:hypothetical protein
MKRLLAPLLSLALVSGQAVLVSVHELRVSESEAGHHLGAAAPAGAIGAPDAHEHHDEADCRVCLGVQSRQEPAKAPRVAAAAAAAQALPAPSAPLRLRSLIAGAAPRGPPLS